MCAFKSSVLALNSLTVLYQIGFQKCSKWIIWKIIESNRTSIDIDTNGYVVRSLTSIPLSNSYAPANCACIYVLYVNFERKTYSLAVVVRPIFIELVNIIFGTISDRVVETSATSALFRQISSDRWMFYVFVSLLVCLYVYLYVFSIYVWFLNCFRLHNIQLVCTETCFICIWVSLVRVCLFRCCSCNHFIFFSIHSFYYDSMFPPQFLSVCLCAFVYECVPLQLVRFGVLLVVFLVLVWLVYSSDCLFMRSVPIHREFGDSQSTTTEKLKLGVWSMNIDAIALKFLVFAKMLAHIQHVLAHPTMSRYFLFASHKCANHEMTVRIEN